MIGAFLASRIGRGLASIGAALVAVLYALRLARKHGETKNENERLKGDADREAKGRRSVKDGRDSGLSPADRVRGNDGDWGGL